MRHLAIIIIAICSTGLSAASRGPGGGSAGGDPFAGLRFSDGVEHSAAEFGSYAVVMVNFCGHCPRAGAWMRNDIKAIHDAIEKERLPVRLVCATPDKTPQELVAYQKEIGMPGAQFAQDTLNGRNISTSNIMQAGVLRDGRQISYLSFDDFMGTFRSAMAGAGKQASYRYPVDGLATDKGKELWWYVERGKPQAISTLVTAAKNSPIKADAERILAVVQPAFLKRQDAAVAAAPGMAAVESLESLLSEGDGLDLKPARERLKALLAMAELKDELMARTAFRRIEELVAKAQSGQVDAAKANFKTLADKLPNTVYGRRAAQMK